MQHWVRHCSYKQMAIAESNYYLFIAEVQSWCSIAGCVYPLSLLPPICPFTSDYMQEVVMLTIALCREFGTPFLVAYYVLLTSSNYICRFFNLMLPPAAGLAHLWSHVLQACIHIIFPQTHKSSRPSDYWPNVVDIPSCSDPSLFPISIFD